jgi:hypothetical protein
LRSLLSRRYEEHIGGSPYTYFVSEGPTDPASCLLDFYPSNTAGEEFLVDIDTYDFHGNPTEHFDDVFLCTLDDGVDVEVTRADDGTVVFSERVTAAGPNRLTIVHVPTNTEVASSPISFTVLPGAPDAASSTHNLGETKSIVSNPGATITVQVFPRDAYGNNVVTATGFKVKMTVFGQEQLSTLRPDEVYMGVIPIPEDLDATITIAFTLNGEVIGDGELVEIAVTPPPPPPDFTNTYIAAGVGGVVLLLGYAAYKRYANKAIVREDEPTVYVPS